MSFSVSIESVMANDRSGLLGSRKTWKRVKLKEVVTIQNGFPFESEKFSKNEGTPLIRIRDIVPGETETFYKGKFDPAFLVNKGDFLIGMDGDFNCALWAGNPALLNQRVCRIVPDETQYLKKFLLYVLPGYLQAINRNTSSLTVKHLSSRTIGDIPLPYPSLKEQREIVSRIEADFGRLDAGVAALKRIQANLKRYRASVLKAACEGKLVPTEAELAKKEGRSYETGAELLTRILAERRKNWKGRGKYKEPSSVDVSKLPTLPSGWCWLSVDAVAFVTKLAGFEYTKYVKYSADGDLAVIKAENAGRFGFKRTEISRIKSSTVTNPTRSQLRAGDVLMVFVGAGTGNVARVPDDQPYFLGPNISMIRVQIKDVSEAYLELFLRSPIGNRLALGFAKAVAQPSLSMGTIRMIPLALPPPSEQKRIVTEVERRLSVIDELDTLVTTNLQRADHLRQAILKKAFSS